MSRLSGSANEPAGWVLVTGHGTSIKTYRPQCEFPEAWVPVYSRRQVAEMMRELLNTAPFYWKDGEKHLYISNFANRIEEWEQQS